jgi:hypothetical protein
MYGYFCVYYNILTYALSNELLFYLMRIFIGQYVECRVQITDLVQGYKF